MKLTTVATGSNGNCYILKDGERMLMLDCGDKVKWKDVLRGCDFQISNVDAMLCTHRHLDHLGHIKQLHNAGIPIVSNPETAEFVKLSRDMMIKGMQEKSIGFLPNHWKTIPWKVKHTGNDGFDVPCFAYYIVSPGHYRVVYMTDFLYSKVRFKNMKPNLVLIACNHDNTLGVDENSAKYRHVVSGHSSLSVVKEIVKINQTDELQHVVLCHLSAENATPDVMLQTIQETVGDSVKVSIAKSGETINL